MPIAVLLINYNEEARNLYIPLLTDNSIIANCTPSMPEALVMLADAEYSGVVINADNFDYLPLLKVMRKLTTAPIGVSVTRYNQEENHTAIKNGADIYRVRYDSAENRVERFSNLVKVYVEYMEGQQVPLTVLADDDIQIFPHTRKVYVRGEDAHLVQKEFDILHYLMMNKGIILTYEQILRRVWGLEYADCEKELLWNQMSRLRGKLQISPDLPEFIITERNYGYCFNPEQNKN